jgi:hypothetical protein
MTRQLGIDLRLFDNASGLHVDIDVTAEAVDGVSLMEAIAELNGTAIRQLETALEGFPVMTCKIDAAIVYEGRAVEVARGTLVTLYPENFRDSLCGFLAKIGNEILRGPLDKALNERGEL